MDSFQYIVVAVIVVDDVSFILKLSFVIIGFLTRNLAFSSDPLISGLCYGFLQSLRLEAVTFFMLCGWACAFHQDKASSVKVPVANVTLSSSAHLLREH
ncbi:hypothetical protein Tco_1112322 [Tanacetum coccineum]|uniref:Uncharacterized protein n=1 Tax=Tanacetum coccineum TaxID=301880 RepID=A0ABQ5IPE3_9ASTR